MRVDGPGYKGCTLLSLIFTTIYMRVNSAGDYNYRNFYTVTAVLEEPYVMHTNHSTLQNYVTNNDYYEGYLVDLVEAISQRAGFRYRIVPVYDEQFGARRSDGSWNGMVGEIVKGNADIAAGAMFRTKGREEVVDFTEPFMQVQATLVMKKHNYGGPIGIDSIVDLLNRPHISVGTLDRGIIRKHFRQTNDTRFQRLYATIENSRTYPYTKSNQEGLERARREPFVYIMPDNIANYIVLKEPCDLKVVDKFLMSSGLSLAVRINSILLNQINHHLGLLKYDGTLDALYKKWWHHNSECIKPASEKASSSFNEANSSLFGGAMCQTHSCAIFTMSSLLVVLFFN